MSLSTLVVTKVGVAIYLLTDVKARQKSAYLRLQQTTKRTIIKMITIMTPSSQYNFMDDVSSESTESKLFDSEIKLFIDTVDMRDDWRGIVRFFKLRKCSMEKSPACRFRYAI